MVKLYDVVRIKDTGITGIVVNISSMNGKTVYTVENNRRGRTGIPGHGMTMMIVLLRLIVLRVSWRK